MSTRGVERNHTVQRHTQRALAVVNEALENPNLSENQRAELEMQRDQIVAVDGAYWEGRNKRSEAKAVTTAMNRVIDTVEGMNLEGGVDTANLGANKTSDVDGASAVGADGATEATGEELLDLMGDPTALAAHFQDNPAEFMESWRDLPAGDRSVVMQALQTEMQLENQITQMITNMMKAAHDTSMSVARNLKV